MTLENWKRTCNVYALEIYEHGYESIEITEIGCSQKEGGEQPK